MAQYQSDTLNAPADKLLLSLLIKLGGHSAISERYVQIPVNKSLKKIKYLLHLQTSSDVKDQRHSLSGPPRRWKMKREFQINFLKAMGLAKSNMLLDIGCGTLRGGIPIIKYLDVGNYTGIDVRKVVLDEGRKELEEEGLKNKLPKLIHFENIRDLNFEKEFDLIFAFAVLGHLDDDKLQSSLEFARRHLSNAGRFFANVHIGSKPDGIWQGFPVVSRSLEHYEDISFKSNLTIKRLGTLSDFGHPYSNGNPENKVMLEFTKLNVHNRC